VSVLKSFQFSTHATITKYESCESQVFVKHMFVKTFWRTQQFCEIFKIIQIFYPC